MRVTIMSLFKPNNLILYVQDITLSTQFYQQILQQKPLETFKDFSAFSLDNNFILGLQTKGAITPEADDHLGGLEICMGSVTQEEVNELYKQWKTLNIPILLEPTHLEFGYTFVALDPDGYRLRICATDTSNIQ